ncbi:MAG: sigma-70 family RNA polymerase sigma factor, partial [Elusimicrobia bacterium]|nr:sigma-70 family RNA polymerase sigma factor [Elusimicrobiota bacterium]
MTDSEIVARVRSGDSQAYAELVKSHYPRVRGLCLSLLSNSSESEDAAQEIFLKAYRFLPQFKSDASFSTWIYRIASNHCLDVLRRQARHRTESLDAPISEENDSVPARLRPDVSEPDSSAAFENKDLVRRVLERLSPDHRVVLVLKETQGLSYLEMAEALECTVDAIKGRLKRARAEL